MQKSKIISGTISLTISTVIVKILGLIYKIPLSNLIGDEGMGYFNSAYAVYTFFFILCTAGVPKAIMIMISEAKATNNKSEEIIVRTAMISFLFLGTIVSLLFIVLANPLSNLIGNRKSAATMIAIAPSIIFISLSGVIRGYLSAEMRLLEISVSQILEGVGKLVFGLIFAILGVRLSLPLPIISALTILGVTFGAIIGLIYLYICSKNHKTDKITGQSMKCGFQKKIIAKIFSISLPITLSAGVMSITGMIDLALIMRGLSKIGYTESEAGAFYGNYTTLAVPMFNLVTALIVPISIAFIPVFTQAHRSNDYRLLDDNVFEAFKMSSIFAAPTMIGLLFFGKEILSLLYKNSEIEIGKLLLCLISPAIFFASLLIILNSVLESCGMVKAPIYSMSLGALAKTIVSYILISNPDIGISGAPIGTVACYAVALICSIIIYTVKFKKPLPIFSSCFIPYVLAFISVSTARYIFDQLEGLGEKNSLLLLTIFLCALIYLGLLLFLGVVKLQKNEKIANYTNQI